MCLYDEMQVFISTKAKTSVKGSQAIVTNNSSFVSIAEAYFQKMWMISQQFKEEDLFHLSSVTHYWQESI